MEPSLSRPQRNRAHCGIDQKNRAPGSSGQSRRLLRSALFLRAARQRISKTAEEGKILKTQAHEAQKRAERREAGPLYGSASLTANELLTGLQDLASQIGYFINLDDDS